MPDKVVPFRGAEVLTEVGGLVDSTSVTLALYADDLEPDEVTRLLGCSPTRTYPKGHRKSRRANPLPRGVWLRTLDGAAPIGPDELIASLFESLPQERTFWNSLITRYDVRISVGIHTAGWNRGFVLKPSTLSRLERTGVALDFGLYMNGDHDV